MKNVPVIFLNNFMSFKDEYINQVTECFQITPELKGDKFDDIRIVGGNFI